MTDRVLDLLPYAILAAFVLYWQAGEECIASVPVLLLITLGTLNEYRHWRSFRRLAKLPEEGGA